MIMRPPNAPDHVCHNCGQMFFRKNLFERLLGISFRSLGGMDNTKGLKCPKCKSDKIGLLIY